jgi:hypothetical protein
MEDPMTGSRRRFGGALALAAGLTVVSGCAPLGAMDGVLVGPAARSAVVEGEIRSVDARRGTLEIRDNRNRSHRMRFDRSTRVVYGQRAYPVTALERGDVVRVRATADRGGVLWADRVDVRHNARDRGRVAVRTERIAGTVSSVDGRRGQFTLSLDRHRSVLVVVPPRLDRDDAHRFQRLRRGDRVRVEVVPAGRGAVELVRFR